MKTWVEDGGWYGDNTLQRDYVSLHRDSHIVCNGKRIELPPGQSNLLQLVCLNWRGQVLIAGQGQKNNNWLWKDNKWIDLGPSFGTFSCTFGPSNLYIVCGNNLYYLYDLEADKKSNSISRVIGANGIRYINFNQALDGIITGDRTYGPSPYNLSQWTSYQDLVLGQSYIDGAVLIRNGIQYKIESGDTEFLRLHYDGFNIAISIVKMLENRTVFYWFDINELNQFQILNPPPVEKEKGPVNNSSIGNSTIKVPIKKEKKPMDPRLPTLDKWIKEEFPQLLAAYTKTQGHTPDPDFEWAAFQTYRRFMEPDVWPFDRMLRHELGDDSENKPNPQ